MLRPAPVLAVAKILNRCHLKRVVQDLRDCGLSIVFTNGCFDLLHPGHIRVLETARAQGNVLIVGVNADQSVRKLNKGSNRPINQETDRALVLAALACVDYVTIFSEADPIPLIQIIKPDVHVKGGDYRAERLPEYPIIRAYGGRVHIVPLVKGKSTTATLAKIKKE